ncbi:MAG TPA: hypothetical protein VEA59_04760 [Patescibacteria group bacterium]|nr:hypothetical protein [Patescibacteria group bacterium]
MTFFWFVVSVLTIIAFFALLRGFVQNRKKAMDEEREFQAEHMRKGRLRYYILGLIPKDEPRDESSILSAAKASGDFISFPDVLELLDDLVDSALLERAGVAGQFQYRRNEEGV